MGIFAHYYMASTRFQDAARQSPADDPGWSASTGLTIVGWINPHTADYSPFVTFRNGSGTALRLIIANTNRIYLHAYEIGCAISADTWLFFSVTISSNTATLKISTDYETLSTGYTYSMSGGWSITYYQIGGEPSNGDYLTDGQIHHVRAFESALSDEELIAELTSTTAAGSPWAAWELNDASLEDATVNDRDLTGSGGTISIGASSAPVIEKADYNAVMIGLCF